MSNLPFDPVKALDLQGAAHKPPAGARVTGLTYNDIPERAFAGVKATTDAALRRAAQFVISVDRFRCASVTPKVSLSYTEWRAFLARCMLAGHPQPIAMVAGASSVFVMCPELFRDGFVNVRSADEVYAQMLGEVRNVFRYPNTGAV